MLNRSRLNQGCLGIFGVATVASVVSLELQGSQISSLISSLGNQISTLTSSDDQVSSLAEQESFSSSVNNFLSLTVWASVTQFFSNSWTQLQEGVRWVKNLFTDLSDDRSNTKAKQLGEGLLNFLKGFFDADIFQRVFTDLHYKLFNLIQLATDSTKREKFVRLFSKSTGENQWDKSLNLVKLLLGLSVSQNQLFKADHRIFNLLLIELLDSPDEIMRKFENLSKSFDKIVKASRQNRSTGVTETSKSNNVYKLELKAFAEYFKIPKGFAETLYEATWTAEILSKLKTGSDLTFGVKSAISFTSSLFNLFFR